MVLAGACVGASCALAAVSARADDLTLATRELGTWNDALAALRGELGSEGTTLHVAVRSHGSPVACERYRLELDDAARSAFRVGACDPATHETALVLEHRAALFDPRFHVPRPRTLAISAVLRATAVASGGPQGGSLVECSWSVRPYLDDLQHGTRVLLTPDHYALRSGSASVTVSPMPDRTGFRLSTAEVATFRLDYEVVELATGDVVLRQKTTLTCGPEAPPPKPAAAPPKPWPEAGARIAAGEAEVSKLEVELAKLDEDQRALEAAETDRPRSARWLPPIDPPAAAADPCRWGRGHDGCNSSPLGPAILTGLLSSAAIAGTATSIYIGATHDDPNAKYIGTFCGVTSAALAVVSTAGHVLAVRKLARPPGPYAPTPSFTVTGGGASLGMAGVF